MEKEMFDFCEALRRMKAGKACARDGWQNRMSIKVMVQTPDENSKMTQPYLYMEKETMTGDVRFPLDLSCESIFAEDWYEVEVMEEVA